MYMGPPLEQSSLLSGGEANYLYTAQLAALSQGLATGQGLETLHGEMHRAKVPWLEVHAPGGIQVTTKCSCKEEWLSRDSSDVVKYIHVA